MKKMYVILVLMMLQIIVSPIDTLAKKDPSHATAHNKKKKKIITVVHQRKDVSPALNTKILKVQKYLLAAAKKQVKSGDYTIWVIYPAVGESKKLLTAAHEKYKEQSNKNKWVPKETVLITLSCNTVKGKKKDSLHYQLRIDGNVSIFTIMYSSDEKDYTFNYKWPDTWTAKSPNEKQVIMGADLDHALDEILKKKIEFNKKGALKKK